MIGSKPNSTMSDYERNTVLGSSEIFEIAHEVLTQRAGVERTRQEDHLAAYSGAEGKVAIETKRHGPETIVTIRTNQLRTSKIDAVVRHLMNQLPYQPDDSQREY